MAAGVVAGRATAVATGVGTGVPVWIDSTTVTLPAGTVSVLPGGGGGGPGAKRPRDMGEGGWTSGAVPEPGFARCGPSAGPSGAGECCASAAAAQPAKQKAATSADLLKGTSAFRE